MKIIRVTGTGKISVAPDCTVLSMKLGGVHEQYEKAVEKSAEHTRLVHDILEDAGLAKEDLKTQSFKIEPEYEKRKKYYDEYENILVGYRYTHRTSITFETDNVKLGRVLYGLAYCAIPVQFSVGYTISNPEAVKNALLRKAAEDSKTKAKVLTDAAGAKLGKLLKIDYSWGEVNLYADSLHDMGVCYSAPEASGSRSYDIEINADDIELSDTVTIEWRIEE